MLLFIIPHLSIQTLSPTFGFSEEIWPIILIAFSSSTRQKNVSSFFENSSIFPIPDDALHLVSLKQKLQYSDDGHTIF